MSRVYGTAAEVEAAQQTLAAAIYAESAARTDLADLYHRGGRHPVGLDAAQSALAFAAMTVVDARAALALLVPLDGKRQRPPRQPLREAVERTNSTRRRRASTPTYFRQETFR